MGRPKVNIGTYRLINFWPVQIIDFKFGFVTIS